jgi:hypothetical protein
MTYARRFDDTAQVHIGINTSSKARKMEKRTFLNLFSPIVHCFWHRRHSSTLRTPKLGDEHLRVWIAETRSDSEGLVEGRKAEEEGEEKEEPEGEGGRENMACVC